jgi:hypothetical protein
MICRNVEGRACPCTLVAVVVGHLAFFGRAQRHVGLVSVTGFALSARPAVAACRGSKVAVDLAGG